jgi:Helix-turn-helix family
MDETAGTARLTWTLAGAAGALRRLLGGLDAEVVAAADLLGRAVGELDCAGRVLGAANAALPVPDDPLARLWQAATVLREHRGDGHAAALVAAGVDGHGAALPQPDRGARARLARGCTAVGRPASGYLVKYQNSGVSQNWIWLAMEACVPDSVFFHTAT